MLRKTMEHIFARSIFLIRFIKYSNQSICWSEHCIWHVFFDLYHLNALKSIKSIIVEQNNFIRCSYENVTTLSYNKMKHESLQRFLNGLSCTLCLFISPHFIVLLFNNVTAVNLCNLSFAFRGCTCCTSIIDTANNA